MNKFSLLVIAGLGLTAMVACDDIDESLGVPQTNPQLPMISTEILSVQTETSVINLASLPADAKVATIVESTDFPDGYTASVPFVQVSPTADFATFTELSATTDEDGAVYVDKDAWDAAQKKLVGKNPNEATNYVRYAVTVTNGKETVRLGGQSYFYDESPVQIKPIDLFGGQVIEQEYYIVTNVSGWSIENAIKMANSGKDAYDDPSFSAILNVPDGGIEYVIIPGTTYAAGQFGLNYGVDPSGMLVESTGAMSTTPGSLTEAGPYMVTADMHNLTTSDKLAIETLYTPGNSNGWQQAASQQLTTTDYKNYSGYAFLDGQFKLTSQADWNGINYGLKDGEVSTVWNADNFSVDAPGLYFVQFNVITLEYSFMPISAIGLIGDATPGGWDADTPLTPSADYLTWTATVKFGNGEFKFRTNNDWGANPNLGGSLDNLVRDGNNIATPGDGTYLVTLDLSSIPYTATLTPQ